MMKKYLCLIYLLLLAVGTSYAQNLVDDVADFEQVVLQVKNPSSQYNYKWKARGSSSYMHEGSTYTLSVVGEHFILVEKWMGDTLIETDEIIAQVFPKPKIEQVDISCDYDDVIWLRLNYDFESSEIETKVTWWRYTGGFPETQEPSDYMMVQQGRQNYYVDEDFYSGQDNAGTFYATVKVLQPNGLYKTEYSPYENNVALPEERKLHLKGCHPDKIQLFGDGSGTYPLELSTDAEGLEQIKWYVEASEVPFGTGLQSQLSLGGDVFSFIRVEYYDAQCEEVKSEHFDIDYQYISSNREVIKDFVGEWIHLPSIGPAGTNTKWYHNGDDELSDNSFRVVHRGVQDWLEVSICKTENESTCCSSQFEKYSIDGYFPNLRYQNNCFKPDERKLYLEQAFDSYQWYYNGEPTENTASAYSFPEPGEYQVEVGLQTLNGYKTKRSAVFTVEENSCNTPQIAYLNECGSPQEPKVYVKGVYDAYQWYYNGKPFVNNTSEWLSPNPGEYEVEVTFTTSSGSETKKSDKLIVTKDSCSYYNLVKVHTARVPNFSTVDQLLSTDMPNKYENHTYIDGMGRVKGNVAINATVKGASLVSYHEYDENGRKINQYLPYVVSGDFSEEMLDVGEQDDFYYNSPKWSIERKMALTDVPYQTVEYEESLRGRVKRQWAVGETKGVGEYSEFTYTWNENSVNVLVGQIYQWSFDMETQSISRGELYPSKSLRSVEVKTPDDRHMWKFTAPDGRLIASVTASNYHEQLFEITYYVYDELLRLRAILPPLVSEKHRQAGIVDKQLIDDYAFRMDYDAYGRKVKDKKPGKGYGYIVYNSYDLPILTQDAVQRTRNEWSFVKYDAFARVIMTGVLQSTSTRKELQEEADQYQTVYRDESYIADASGNLFGYSNRSYPTVDASEVFSINYYDVYPTHEEVVDISASPLIEGVKLAGKFSTGLHSNSVFYGTTGFLLASQTRVLGTDDWLKSTSFYDKDGRLVQSKSTNHLGGSDIISIKYDWEGKLLRTHQVHTGSGKSVDIQSRTEYYDNGSPKAIYQTIDHGIEEKLSEVAYNELGQTVQKILGSNLQQVDYQYHIRGWLSAINGETFTGEDQEQPKDLFSMTLHYDDIEKLGGEKYENEYSGNISGIRWQNASDEIVREYRYRYDGLERLVSANYQDDAIGSEFDYSVPEISYDAQGNILYLTRNGKKNYSFNQLEYTYKGNQLEYLFDDSDLLQDEPKAQPDFVSPHFSYDANGNMRSNRHKQIEEIRYNYLDQPTEVILSENRKLKYLYDAGGTTLRKEIYENNILIKSFDYVGSFVYEDAVMRYVKTSEGRAIYDITKNRWKYEYHLNDHQGNLRVAFLPGDQDFYYTSMEDANQEEFEFGNVSLSSDYAASGLLSAKTGNGYSEGPWKELTVTKDDTLKVVVKVLTPGTPQSKAPIVPILQFNALPSSTESGSISTNISLGLSAPIRINHPLPNPPVTSISTYGIEMTLYDLEGEVVERKMSPIQISQTDIWHPITLDWVVPDSGRVEVRLVNKGSTTRYFDDFQISHHKVLDMQVVGGYYPFGKKFGAEANQDSQYPSSFTYMGVEHEESFDLNWYETAFRRYDPEIGRFSGVDAMASKYFTMTPYQYGANNPIRFNDPSGLDHSNGSGKDKDCPTCLPEVNIYGDRWTMWDELDWIAEQYKKEGWRSDNMQSLVDKYDRPGWWSDDLGKNREVIRPDYDNMWGKLRKSGLLGSFIYGALDAPYVFGNTFFLGPFNNGEVYHLDGSGANDIDKTNAFVEVATEIVTGSTASSLNAANKTKKALNIVDEVVEEGVESVAGVTKKATQSTEIATYYPENNGALGEWVTEYLMPGTKIDRFGSGYGKYFSPYGTPMDMRALPSGNTGAYNAFQVVKPFPVQSSTIAPAFNKIGLGTQYLSPVNMNTLLKRGIIVPLK